MKETELDDLRRYVLAENVTVAERGEYGPALYTTFDFLCPNCGKRHWAREVSDERFQVVCWELPCGRVSVRMPWASTPERDGRSVYGQRGNVEPGGRMAYGPEIVAKRAADTEAALAAVLAEGSRSSEASIRRLERSTAALRKELQLRELLRRRQREANT